jgi:hypothetical protein
LVIDELGYLTLKPERNPGKTLGSRRYQAGCPRQRTSSARGGTTV